MANTSYPDKPPFGVFLAMTVVIFFLTFSAADSVGFVPYYVDGTEPRAKAGQTAPKTVDLAAMPQLGGAPAQTETTLPVRIKIPAIGLDLPVQNPATRDITALDTLLQNGPARYVDSAQLGTPGNVLIFAHSSHLPVVHNQMYRAFNRVPELNNGDTIELTGKDGTTYLYSVVSVEKADVNDAVIDLSSKQGTRLTLVTCDTLTGTSARFVLEAVLVGTTGID
jgi:LPXTG-site transpeptidase (sortase) family protein